MGTIRLLRSLRTFLLTYFTFRKTNVQVAYPVAVSDEATVGEYTYIGSGSFIGFATIGRYCSIGPNVMIGLGEHDMKRISTNSLFYENAKKLLLTRRTTIAHDVWIGANTIIRQGVAIGTGAVVGANSFVNHDVEAYAVVAGSPARHIRDRFSPEEREQILKSQWWLAPPCQAKATLLALQAELEGSEKNEKGTNHE